ncbi:hypothetical protein K470DRAFT_256181 [Piedraia hortae CBS 480.64]|uniref:SHSP domain-containing protein n=1 Tax=Piedraia hortae CBS 480.64 TaxID=1314780 RepID=A0A6A7C3P9_9PEZI|nr:hypothetical protein K470DRAFT_256181 [Piedraia hortae CBS 480.64]
MASLSLLVKKHREQVLPPGKPHHSKPKAIDVTCIQIELHMEEIKEDYIIQGTLPGAKPKDVWLDFVGTGSMTIKARYERSHDNYSDHNRKGAADEDKKVSGKVKGGANHETGPKLSVQCTVEFSQSFTFAHPVRRERTAAKLEDGLLSVTVPKARRPTNKRVRFEFA